MNTLSKLQFSGTGQTKNRLTKRIKKTCLGCGDNFTCFKPANYAYCPNCALNGTRYWQNLCPECGNGSGI